MTNVLNYLIHKPNGKKARRKVQSLPEKCAMEAFSKIFGDTQHIDPNQPSQPQKSKENEPESSDYFKQQSELNEPDVENKPTADYFEQGPMDDAIIDHKKVTQKTHKEPVKSEAHEDEANEEKLHKPVHGHTNEKYIWHGKHEILKNKI